MSRATIRLAALFCLTAEMVLFAVGCTPSVKTPLSGHVSLQYSNRSESGLIFDLENGLSEPIRFRGYGALPGDVTPDVYSMLCDSEATGTATAVGGWLKDGGPRPSRIKVMPGERIHFVVSAEYFQRYKGQRCKFNLILESHSEVKSQEFVP